MADGKQIANELVEKIKALVKEGNVTRIRIKKDDKEILSVPMTLGVAGAFIGVAAAPWAVIIGAIAMIGLDCKIEVEKKNGEVTVLDAIETEACPDEPSEETPDDAE